MKKVELLNIKGEKVKDINLNEEIFGITPNLLKTKFTLLLVTLELEKQL